MKKRIVQMLRLAISLVGASLLSLGGDFTGSTARIVKLEDQAWVLDSPTLAFGLQPRGDLPGADEQRL